jgi:hypothetical protein
VVTAKTLTMVRCNAKGVAKTITKQTALGKVIARSLKVTAGTDGSRVSVSAGHWTRDTAKNLITQAYVSNMAVLRLTKKGKASAHSSSDSSKPVMHGVQFDFATTKTLKGTLTLKVSGTTTKGATDNYEIKVIGDGWTKTLKASSEKRFTRLVLKDVSIGTKGLRVQIKSYAVATLSDKGHCRAQGRATVRFEVKKS